MDHNRRALTRPATPRAFRVSDGRYSFAPPTDNNSRGFETIELPDRLREEKVTVREMSAVRR